MSTSSFCLCASVFPQAEKSASANKLMILSFISSVFPKNSRNPGILHIRYKNKQLLIRDEKKKGPEPFSITLLHNLIILTRISASPVFSRCICPVEFYDAMYKSGLNDYRLGKLVLVQVPWRDLCKRKRPEMLVQVQDSDLYKHPFSQVRGWRLHNLLITLCVI